MLIQNERGPQHVQKVGVGEVCGWCFLLRIVNELVENVRIRNQRRERALVPCSHHRHPRTHHRRYQLALAPPMPRASATKTCASSLTWLEDRRAGDQTTRLLTSWVAGLELSSRMGALSAGTRCQGHGRRERARRVSRKETEAMLANIGCLEMAEDGNSAQVILREIPCSKR